MRKPTPFSKQMSDKLYHGYVSGADEALWALVRGLESEIEEARRWNDSLDPNDADTPHLRWDESVWRDYLVAARQARSIWREEMEAAQTRVLERIRALATDDAATIADAIEAEAWDGLAW